MGEVANIIAGQAKTLLAETPYQLVLATPTILSGPGIEVGARPGGSRAWSWSSAATRESSHFSFASTGKRRTRPVRQGWALPP